MKDYSRSSKKRSRDPKPDTSRKKQKQKSLLAKAFTEEDTPYLPPTSLRSGSKDAPSKARIVPRLAKKNKRDPFHVLNDDEVHQIITLLPARDTETLRRVCKLWKASSEYHCGKLALLKHFPWVASKADRFISREEANLQFRRYLHHQESLIAGNATRALKCSGVTNWHIGQDSLVWLDSQMDVSEISLCALKSYNGGSTKSFDVVELDAKNLVSWQICVRYVLLAPDGELIVLLNSLDGPPMERDVRTWFKGEEKLIKMSRAKAITWQVTLKAMVNRPAIGKDAIYFVRGQQDTPSDSTEPAFFKVNLKDGSIIYEVPLASHITIALSNSNVSLKLTADERLAVWTGIDNTAYVFSTGTGELIYTWDRPLGKGLVVSSTKNKFWDIHLRSNIFGPIGESNIDDKRAKPFTIERLYLPEAYFGESRFFDGDRLICGSLWHENPFPGLHDPWRPSRFRDVDVVDPFTVIKILAGPQSTTRYLEHFRQNPTNPYPWQHFQKTTTITLPSRSTKERERRTLEAELPWVVDDGDFFGMCEDYLVLHSRSDKTLLLVDYWPAW